MARRELAEETQRFIRNCPEQEINVAIMKGDVEWVEELLSKDVNINVQAFAYHHKYHEPVQIASELGHVDILRLLLSEPDVDVNATIGYETALSNAVRNGHNEVVEILLKDERIQVNQNKGVALFTACESNKLDAVRLLLQHPDIDPNLEYDSNSPLMIACEKGYIEVVRLLFQSAKINVNSEHESTGICPYFTAVWNGNDEIAELFETHPQFVTPD